jgi:predicted O-methyltransferase YrrM
MTSPRDKAFATFLRYNEDLSQIKANENVEGGSTIEQVKYFINFITARPEIKVILEIGFNTGSSAAYFLSSRDDIKVISVDIGVHGYVNDCKRLIDTHFPGRHTLLIGDSKVVIPLFSKETKIVPDLIFIDGDHAEPTPLIDVRNCLKMAGQNTILVMDDTNLINGWNGVLQAMCTIIKNKETDFDWLYNEQYGTHAWTIFRKPRV